MQKDSEFGEGQRTADGTTAQISEGGLGSTLVQARTPHAADLLRYAPQTADAGRWVGRIIVSFV